MEILRAAPRHIEPILDIYAAARAYMQESGNPNQWGASYPPRERVEADILSKNLYMCIENGEIYGVFFYSEETEPTYQTIYDGAWLNDAPCGVMHRVAVSRHGCGVAKFCFDFCFARCQNLKIDTHRDNTPMRRALEKNGFALCGRIRLADGSERLAFQKSAKSAFQKSTKFS